jgi:hypothetical protein
MKTPYRSTGQAMVEIRVRRWRFQDRALNFTLHPGYDFFRSSSRQQCVDPFLQRRMTHQETLKPLTDAADDSERGELPG